ncbi:MAG: hypothetical protein MJA29_08510, partial [Candidatus Omnitrophica bacterium]|nr:hypothetical protein [Candidatus Omnitrophota bacterium]
MSYRIFQTTFFGDLWHSYANMIRNQVSPDLLNLENHPSKTAHQFIFIIAIQRVLGNKGLAYLSGRH